jgi:NAD(P)-dependent dehydrogenase (short-subunit alcohol dehydrogenase family)
MDRKVWFITGASRGMGVEFAKAALAAGHAVVATGRSPDAVTRAIGEADGPLVVKLNVTRAVLPIMRRQPSGHIPSISSGAGLYGFEYNSTYCAVKFGLEGWMESLAPEVAPFGIHTTIVNPGFFLTELLSMASRVQPPRRFYADTDAIAVAEQKVQPLQQQINAYRNLSTSMALEEI